MIYITCGTCGTSQGYKTKADGALSLPAAEEARLVSRGVAVYATKPIIGPAARPVAPAAGRQEGGAGVTLPGEEYAPPGAEGAGSDTPSGKATEGLALPDCLDIEDGHITRDSLLLLSRADMEALAVDLKVDVSKCRNKSEIADLLSAVEIQPSEPISDEPPELGAEGPIV